MSHYRTGTVNVTNGSLSVVGVGTDFIAGAAIGECLAAPDGKLYEIASIQSATGLTLGTGYLGATVTGQAYSIIPTQSYIRDLALQAATLVNGYQAIVGGPGSGKFDDGTVGSPGIQFAADANTGIRRTGTDAVAVVTGGVDRLTVSSAGVVAVPGNTALGDAEASDTHAIKGATTLLTNSASAALTVTQTGAGNAFVVEDSATPDTTPFAISAAGLMSSSGPYYQSADYGEVRFRGVSGANLNGWRLVHFINGASDGNLVLQHTTDNFSANFIDALTLGVDGASSVKANSSSAALTVTQTGAGNAFVVEDSASTDTTPFVIDAAGLVGVGGASPADHLYVFGAGQTTSALTDAGNRLANLFISASGSSAGDGGSVSLGTLVANGVRQQWALKTLLTDGSANGKSALVISGRADTADTALTERMRIDSAGNVGIGASGLAGFKVTTGGTSAGATSTGDFTATQTINPAVSTIAHNVYSNFNAVSAGSLPTLSVYLAQQATFTGTVGIQFGFHANSTLTGATNNYGFYANIAAASSRWNFYAAGTAANYFGGNVTVGGGGTLGYGAGSGGTVTQATSKSTSVTLNKPSGQITMAADALAAGASALFLVNNTAAGASDSIVANVSVLFAKYDVEAGTPGVGSFYLRVTNITGGSLSEAPVINFAVIKGSTS